MKLPETHINQIKLQFEKMQTKEDLLQLMNEVKPILYGEKTAKPFKLQQLTWYANPGLGQKRYISFEVKKKSGAGRTIHAPVNGLKAIQSVLNAILQCVFQPHVAATGFVQGKSVVDNAKLHAGKRYVYNIDLKDFFPSIDQGRVWACLKLRPFNLGGEGNSKRQVLCNMIAALCCTEMEVERLEGGEWKKKKLNVLPQGAPTSPVITNIVCQRLDFLLSAVAKRFGLTYSRYADDITFSSEHNVYQADSEFLSELHRIIREQNFHIKDSKTRLHGSGYRKEVTGLVVNEHANVHKRYIKQIRQWLYYWETYGQAKALSLFLQTYKGDKGHMKQGNPSILHVIAGKLDYLKMVKGEENTAYKKLKERLALLITLLLPQEDATDREKHLSTVLSMLDEGNVEQALEYYTPLF